LFIFLPSNTFTVEHLILTHKLKQKFAMVHIFQMLNLGKENAHTSK